MGSTVFTLEGFDDKQLSNGYFLLALIDGACFVREDDDEEEEEKEYKVDWDQVFQADDETNAKYVIELAKKVNGLPILLTWKDVIQTNREAIFYLVSGIYDIVLKQTTTI